MTFSTAEEAARKKQKEVKKKEAKKERKRPKKKEKVEKKEEEPKEEEEGMPEVGEVGLAGLRLLVHVNNAMTSHFTNRKNHFRIALVDLSDQIAVHVMSTPEQII